ncbi:MAG: hypothetical protein AAF458_05545 [Pseudomonadota bacterium]
MVPAPANRLVQSDVARIFTPGLLATPVYATRTQPPDEYCHVTEPSRIGSGTNEFKEVGDVVSG